MTAKPAAPTELSFTDVEVPATTAKPNAFTPKVETMTAAWNDKEGRSTTAASVTVPTADKAKYLRMIEGAGKAVGKSIRKTATETGDKTVITFWVVDKITRTPKTADAATGTADVTTNAV